MHQWQHSERCESRVVSRIRPCDCIRGLSTLKTKSMRIHQSHSIPMNQPHNNNYAKHIQETEYRFLFLFRFRFHYETATCSRRQQRKMIDKYDKYVNMIGVQRKQTRGRDETNQLPHTQTRMNQQHQTEERNTNFRTTNNEDDGDCDGGSVEDQICSLPQLPIHVANTDYHQVWNKSRGRGWW